MGTPVQRSMAPVDAPCTYVVKRMTDVVMRTTRSRFWEGNLIARAHAMAPRKPECHITSCSLGVIFDSSLRRQLRQNTSEGITTARLARQRTMAMIGSAAACPSPLTKSEMFSPTEKKTTASEADASTWKSRLASALPSSLMLLAQ